jgi:acetyltransferase-like isoleucine patch superfamily enzyme
MWVGRKYLAYKGVRCGPRLRMYSLPLCSRHPLATIEIGSDVTILNRLSENASGISHRTVLVAGRPQASLKIGNHVGISGAVLFCTREIVIEDFVNLGADSCVYDSDLHPIQSMARRERDHDAVTCAPVRICEDAWIGARAIILKGVTIGPRSVVGAGAVVTKDVPPDTIVAGVPARVVAKIDASS